MMMKSNCVFCVLLFVLSSFLMFSAVFKSCSFVLCGVFVFFSVLLCLGLFQVGLFLLAAPSVYDHLPLMIRRLDPLVSIVCRSGNLKLVPNSLKAVDFEAVCA